MPNTGAASAHFQVLSTESRKYIQNVIIMSATAFNYWVTSEKNDHLDIAYQLAKDMGKPTTQFNELVEILNSETPANLIKYSLNPMTKLDRTIKLLLCPVIERKIKI